MAEKFCPILSYVDPSGMMPFDCPGKLNEDDKEICAWYSEAGECCVFVTYTRLFETIWYQMRFSDNHNRWIDIGRGAAL